MLACIVAADHPGHLRFHPVWFRLVKNQDVSTGPLTCLFACWLSLLIPSLTPYARFSGALNCAHLFACSLILLTPKLVGKCVILSQNYLILNYSAISPAQQTQILTLTSLSDCGRCVALRIDSNSHAAQARTSVVREDETRVLLNCVLLNCSYKKDETHVLINCVLIKKT